MKNHKLAGSICTLLLTALGATSAAAQTSSPVSILFNRTLYRAIDGTHGSALYRVKPSGLNMALLVPVTYGVDLHGDGWSPSGAAALYETNQPSQLYVVDRQGANARPITTGSGVHTLASWGPSGLIAYVTSDNGPYVQCLGTVRADGTNQHIVFCPPREAGMARSIYLAKPRWSANGATVLVEAHADEGGLEPDDWYSNVYRVNVSTGAAVKVAGQVFIGVGDGPLELAIAPDGKHGVYSGNPMYAVDFTTNTRRALSTYGSDLRYSPDGSRIAFLKAPFVAPYYSNVYVMNADGSHVHKALAETNPNVTYVSIADWSFDSTRLLVNQVGDDRWLQIIDLRSHTAANVTKGTADRDAWFHP